MKNLILLFAIFWSASQAQALVLGELKGTGSFKAQTIAEDATTNHQANCTIALNIEFAENYLSIPYSYFECKGLNVWNDVLSVGIKDGKVFALDQHGNFTQEIGSVEADGSVNFTLSNSRLERVTEYIPGTSCRPEHSTPRQKTFTINNSWNFKIKKISNDEFTIERRTSHDQLYSVNKRIYNCNYYSVEKAVTTTELIGSVKK